MNRSSQHESIVLHIGASGESNATVELLTRDRGVVRATAFGLRSARSKLRGSVVPFARGTVWLYTDPRRQSVKITDAVVERYALSVSEELSAYAHASLWAEVMWRTYASGDDADAAPFELLDAALARLEGRGVHDADAIRLLSIQVIWRYLAILGVRPDPDICGRTGRPIAPDAIRYLDEREGVFVAATPTPSPAGVHGGAGALAVGASSAGRPGADRAPLPPGAAAYLRRTASAPLDEALGVGLAEGARRALWTVLMVLVRQTVPVPVNTLMTMGRWL